MLASQPKKWQSLSITVFVALPLPALGMAQQKRLRKRVSIMPQSTLMVEPVSALKDNYIWMFQTGPDSWAAVDPGEADPVLRHLDRHAGTLSHILMTHHHHDHTGGVEALQERFKAEVIGAKRDRHRLPDLDRPVADGEQWKVGNKVLTAMDVPGHTIGHIVYLIDGALFAGDTLFRFGCGRLFEGSPQQMWKSLLKIRALPDTTQLYAAHEYTQVNLAFACALQPSNAPLHAKQAPLLRQIEQKQPTMPAPLSEEKRYNPFFRADDPAFAREVGLTECPASSVFAALRERRNVF